MNDVWIYEYKGWRHWIGSLTIEPFTLGRLYLREIVAIKRDRIKGCCILVNKNGINIST